MFESLLDSDDKEAVSGGNWLEQLSPSWEVADVTLRTWQFSLATEISCNKSKYGRKAQQLRFENKRL